MLKLFAVTTGIAIVSLVAGSAQTTGPVAAASKAMGVEGLNAITYSGTARMGTFGQSKAIGDPMGAVNVTQVTAYTRTISFAPAADPAALVSRASGPTMPPAVPGTPPPSAGMFNQNITGSRPPPRGRRR